MALNVEFENMIDVWLRDTEGHRLITATMTELSGTYEPGGLILEPEMFGLSEIGFMYLQQNVAVPLTEVGGEGDGWGLLFSIALMNYEGTWRAVFHFGPAILGADFDEVPADTPINMAPEYAPVVLVMGS